MIRPTLAPSSSTTATSCLTSAPRLTLPCLCPSPPGSLKDVCVVVVVLMVLLAEVVPRTAGVAMAGGHGRYRNINRNVYKSGETTGISHNL
jgi:hypothetical protein